MATAQIPINYIALESRPTTDMLFATTQIPTFELAEIGINKYVSQLENIIASRCGHVGPIYLYKVKSMHACTEMALISLMKLKTPIHYLEKSGRSPTLIEHTLWVPSSGMDRMDASETISKYFDQEYCSTYEEYKHFISVFAVLVPRDKSCPDENIMIDQSGTHSRT